MADSKPLPTKIYIGSDSRELVASDVAAHSIRRRTKHKVDIEFLNHRELRRAGKFARPWLVDGPTGNWTDLIDGKPFSTEFSHTRFLVPHLMNYQGWALFMDADMIFLSDVKKLFEMVDDKYALMCVKHNHIVKNESVKMDGRAQLMYRRKNWSSFVLWNCGHPMNRQITVEKVNFMKGSDLHAFSWLPDEVIGSLPYSYNYISGSSPHLAPDDIDMLHYTDGGPWFVDYTQVPLGELWLEEYEHLQNNSEIYISGVPSTAFEMGDKVRQK